MRKSSEGGHSILAEYQALLRMMVVEALEELGHRVSHAAGRIEQAIS